MLCYASRSLLRPEKNYCVMRRELLAVLFAVRKFKAYLGGEVRLRTDHHGEGTPYSQGDDAEPAGGNYYP